MFRKLLLCIVISLFLISPSWAGEYFDGGKDAMVYIASAVVTTYPFSVSLLHKDASSSSSETLWAVSDISANTVYFQLRVDSGVLSIVARNTTFYAAAGGTNIADSTWRNIIVIFRSATDREAYLNNVSEVTDADNVSFSANFDKMSIGAYHRSSDAFEDAAQATIDEVYVYDNKDLSATEREILAKSRTRRVGLQISNCVLYWALDEVADGASFNGSTFNDLSGTGNTGTGVTGAGGIAKGGEVLSYPD